MDNDVTKEVQRVKEGILDVCVTVREYIRDETTKTEEWKKRKERERRGTKGVDDEFWLNV